MTRETPLRQLRLWARAHANRSALDDRRVKVRLVKTAVARFKRIGGQTAVPVRHSLDGPPPPIRHPICHACAASPTCEEHWLADLTELQRQWQPIWHRCPGGNWCGWVPLAQDAAGLIACQLVCDGSMRRADFCSQLELLTVLIEGAMSAVWSDRPGSGSSRGAEADVKEQTASAPESRRTLHPGVRRALEIVRNRLKDKNLTVAGVAREVGMNSTYLAHLFRQQTAVRLSEFIVRERVTLAKSLLCTTDWQIKKVALETGHHRADWFSQVFRRHTGLTPQQYRQANCPQGASGARR